MRAKSTLTLLIIVLLALICSNGWAQEYPEIFFLRGYHFFASGGPDWSDYESSTFYSQDNNPLCIDSLHYVHIFEDASPEFNVHIDEIRPFDGDMELHPDYFIVRSPIKLFYGMPKYRISKISYDGYYLEDCLIDSLESGDYFLKAWHFYDNNMRNSGTVIKYYDPLSYQKIENILDLRGRRVEEYHYSSTDSLDWQATGRIFYEYETQPFSESREYEKYAQYMPGYILDLLDSFGAIYVNNNYPISTMTFQFTDSYGMWMEPCESSVSYEQIPEEEYVCISIPQYMLDTQFCFNAEGLLTQLNQIEDLPTYTFYYDLSNPLSLPHTPQIPSIHVNIGPNPVKQTATLRYSLAKASPLSISTYNIKGQLLKRECHNNFAQSGEVIWNPTDAKGKTLSNGIYLIRVEGEGFGITKRLIVSK